MAERDTPTQPLTRRRALRGAAAFGVGVPVLAACSGEGAPTSATDPDTPSASESPAGTAGSTSSAAPEGLASSSDIPVGGGKIFPDDDVVIVQPTAGDFRGWSATCTHQGCTVAEVNDGEIKCPCHASSFSIEDGSPTGGPATAPLTEVPLTVQGDSISLA